MLRECLESTNVALAEIEEETELVVVDNGGGRDVTDVLAKSAPDACLLELPTNIGYPGAAMMGIGRARGTWIAVINDDVILGRQALGRLLVVGERDKRIGAVGAQIRFADRPQILNSAGIDVDHLGVAFDRHVGEPVTSSESSSTPVFGVSGAAAIFRQEMLNDVGGFDTSFFGYLEDVDLAWRARMKGWSSVYEPTAVAYHHHAQTFTHASEQKYFLVGRNRVRLIAKNASLRQLLLFGPAIALYDLAYVLFVVASRGSLAPLRGRIQGAREWRRYRTLGRDGRRPIELAPTQGLIAAVRRHRAWSA